MEKNPELLILTAIVQNRCLDEVLKAGLRPDHFGMPTTKAAFEYLLDYRKEPGQAGAIPTLAQFRRKCPWFQAEFPPEATTPTSLTRDLMEVSLQREIATGVFDLKEKKSASIEDVEKLIGTFKDLISRHKTLNLANASEATTLVREWYNQSKKGGITGIPYPWDALNAETRGVQQHDFILIFARPKQTKTWQLLKFLICLQDFLIAQGKSQSVLFVSYEMDLQRLMNRLACIKAKVSYGKFNKKGLSKEELVLLKSALAELEKAKEQVPIFFAGPAISATSGRKGFSILDIEQAADDIKPAAIFIDGLLHASDVRTGKKSREWSIISNISSDVKQMSLLLHCPVIATHQANRESEIMNPISTQRDIAYADALAQDCDLTLRITKLKPGKDNKRTILIQPEGAREFELLGIHANSELCENMDQIGAITEESDLRKLLAKAIIDPVEEARAKAKEKESRGVTALSQAASRDTGVDLQIPSKDASPMVDKNEKAIPTMQVIYGGKPKAS